MRTYRMNIGGEPFEARILEYSESRVVVSLNGDIYEVDIEADVSSPAVTSPPRPATRQESPASRPAPRHESAPPRPVAPPPVRPVAAAAAAPGTVTAPLPGVVRSILVAEGDTVTEGQPVIVLEAMKMENEISARSSGVVTKIHVAEGTSVQEDQPLLEIGEPA